MRGRNNTGRSRGVAAVMCAAAALAVGACGGEDDETTTAAQETTAAEDQEAAVEQTLIDFGASEGTDACQYFSQRYLVEEIGGEAGCEKEFKEAVAADYDVQEVTVSDDSARADVDAGEQQVFFELVLEDGEWKIDDLRGE